MALNDEVCDLMAENGRLAKRVKDLQRDLVTIHQLLRSYASPRPPLIEEVIQITERSFATA